MTPLARGAAVCVALGFCLVSQTRADLRGRWRLVEQRYGSGLDNLADAATPLRLELTHDGPRPSCRILLGDPPARTFDWPAWVDDHHPRPVRVDDRSIDETGGRLRASYRASLSDDGTDGLAVTEEYVLSPDGRSLSGTVTVTQLEDGASRGSYTLRRRFEREP